MPVPPEPNPAWPSLPPALHSPTKPGSTGPTSTRVSPAQPLQHPQPCRNSPQCKSLAKPSKTALGPAQHSQGCAPAPESAPPAAPGPAEHMEGAGEGTGGAPYPCPRMQKLGRVSSTPHTLHGQGWTEGSWQPQGFWAPARWSRQLSTHCLCTLTLLTGISLCPCPGSSQGDRRGQLGSPHVLRTVAAGTWEQQVPQGCGDPRSWPGRGCRLQGTQQGRVKGTGRTSLGWGVAQCPPRSHCDPCRNARLGKVGWD